MAKYLLTSISLLDPFNLEPLRHGFPSSFFREEKVEEEDGMFALGFEILLAREKVEDEKEEDEEKVVWGEMFVVGFETW